MWALVRTISGLLCLGWLTGCVFEAPAASGGEDPSSDPTELGPKDGAVEAGDDARAMSADAADAGALDDELPDAETDPEAGTEPDAAIVCPAGSDFCDGRWRISCNELGNGIVEGSQVECNFTCVAGECVAASNLDPTTYSACDGSAPALTPVAGATITIDSVSIACTPNCGDPQITALSPAGSVSQQQGPSLAWYCLSRVDLSPGTVVVAGANVSDPVALLVDGEVTVDGRIALVGADAINTTAGAAGLGGGAGGPLSNGNGMNGRGPCPGSGGSRAGNPQGYGAGGGAGGGFGGGGGAGGDGRSGNNFVTGQGGEGSDACAPEALSPLVGGSGGGAGADGNCIGSCGWPGGGGGGAIQISSRSSIRIVGVIDVSGGDGYGVQNGGGASGGGGGGGSGGAILLEAPVLGIAGALIVDGGNGGSSGAGAGGSGAAGGAIDGTNGGDFQGPGQGGRGGGGGAGRVRLNHSNDGPMCGMVSPAGTCVDANLSPDE